MYMRSRTIAFASIALLIAINFAEAAKGDLRAEVPRSSPLLEGRSLDLRFAEFAQGIWTKEPADCQDLTTIDRAKPGTAIAIYRGLYETPAEICQVYGAEQRSSRSQRAAMSCHLVGGGYSLGLVTVRPIGSAGLSVQDGKHPPAHYQFCRAITPVIQQAGQ